jgi:hypothetical protein
VEPEQPIDPTKDKRINAAFYGVTVSPTNCPGTIQTLLFTDSRRAGSTSIAMALCGRWLPAGIRRASTGASAKGHSTGQLRQGNIAPRVGRSINYRGRSYRRLLIQEAPRPVIMIGWTSSTLLDWERTCQLPPATEMTRYLRCYPTAGSLLCFVYRIPWDSTRKVWTAGSTIRRLVGREKACGLLTALELLFTRKVVKERRARSCISSFAPTLSRTRRLTRNKRIPSVAKFRVAR